MSTEKQKNEAKKGRYDLYHNRKLDFIFTSDTKTECVHKMVEFIANDIHNGEFMTRTYDIIDRKTGEIYYQHELVKKITETSVTMRYRGMQWIVNVPKGTRIEHLGYLTYKQKRI
jgi:hypothetical protein